MNTPREQMLIHALLPFAELLEEPKALIGAPINLEIDPSDVAEAQRVLEDLGVPYNQPT